MEMNGFDFCLCHFASSYSLEGYTIGLISLSSPNVEGNEQEYKNIDPPWSPLYNYHRPCSTPMEQWTLAVILLGSFLIWRINTSKRATVAQYVWYLSISPAKLMNIFQSTKQKPIKVKKNPPIVSQRQRDTNNHLIINRPLFRIFFIWFCLTARQPKSLASWCRRKVSCQHPSGWHQRCRPHHQ